jgi:two-component system, NtrC family, sensor kinase
MPENAGFVNKPVVAGSQEAHARLTTIRLLQLLSAAALLLPILIFGFASWLSYQATQALAHERIERSLDVMQEHALKVFQSISLALDTIDKLVGDRSAAEIQRDEPRLHEQLKEVLGFLPDVQSIWLFGPAGRPEVITRESPPPTLNYGDQDYFLVPRDQPDKIYIGGIHMSVSGGEPYFTFDRARQDARGAFAGVIEMSLLPNEFSAFYEHLATGPGVGFSLVREDGTILARFPKVPPEVRRSSTGGFQRVVATNPTGGFYETVSQIDHTNHLIGVRRLPTLPIYVSAFIQTNQIWHEWMMGMATHLLFGIPATLFLFFTLLAVLRRTKRLYAEIDQRIAAEESLRQAQRLDSIGQLTGGVAHDFNNLLTIILGNLEAAKRQLGEWTDAAHLSLGRRIENAMHGATRAATLTRRLLAFARQTPLTPSVIDVNRLLNSLSEFLRRALGEDVSLEIVGAAGLWRVESDAAELEAALLNLAVNARDAMPDGGKLTIETSNSYLDEAYSRQYAEVIPGQYVLIAVSDTGVGMPKEVIERAFEPFFTTKDSGQGTGLGLSQVYGFVKQSGGHVKIYSERGEGTTVKMYLRRFAGEASPERQSKVEPERGRSGECVLVVEDDADVRSYVVETLRSLGYDVLEASGGADALRLIERHKTISLLLTDVVMPGKNGRKLAEEARQRSPALKVLYMTGYSRNAIVHQGRLDADVDLIQKPLTREPLATAVRKILDGG